MNQGKKLESLFEICRQASLSDFKVTDRSSQIQKGDIFVAIKGIQHDGHQFISKALEKGAETLVVENLTHVPSTFKGSCFVVVDTKKVLPILLNHYHNFPSEKMFCVGVTGTNGKTTVSYMVEHLFKHSGWKVGLIGTIDAHIEGEIFPSLLTTPCAVDLQERISYFYKKGINSTVMEVSSIGLDQYRADCIDFNVAVFTNLARDHLDYHQSIDKYYQSKKRFFEILKQSNSHSVAVLNADDEYSLACQNICGVTSFTYGIKGKDLSYKITKETLEGIYFSVFYKKQKKDVFLPMIGTHNASNAAAALLTGLVAGFSLESLCEILAQFPGVLGRLQRVQSKKPFSVFIDYAHTPDALDVTLRSLKNVQGKNQNLILVFGCGGDRDQGKREMIGRVADQYADILIITSDNPRNEDPQKIIKDIIKGVKSNSSQYHLEEDRGKAIEKACSIAKEQDIVLIVGKGHETLQLIKDKRIPFNDYDTALNLLNNM